LAFLGVLTPTNGFTKGLQFPGRTSVANRLSGVFINPWKSATYWGFTKPLVLPGVSGTPTIPWVFSNSTTAWGF